MSEEPIQIIDTGVANIHSLQAAFSRLGHTWDLTKDPEIVANAERVVLPGVGTFSAAIESIDQNSLREPIVERIAANRRTLSICLGLQVLCESSEESPGVKGLGILPNQIRRFSRRVQVPQLGWNTVTPKGEASFKSGEAYFANSYRLADEPVGWQYATTDYDGEFYSCFWRSNVLACQFHPELSGEWGQQVLATWVEGSPC